MTPITVVVDPGHGGDKPGAVWPLAPQTPTILEKHINMSIAAQLQTALEGSGWNVACSLTREEDEDLSLGARAALSKKLGADLVICIHCNAAPEAAHGLMAFVEHEDAPAAEVANAILAAAPLELRRGNASPVIAGPQGWTAHAHAVLAQHECPAVLVECGFLTHGRDREILTSVAGQAEIVAALLCGVARYQQILQEGEAP